MTDNDLHPGQSFGWQYLAARSKFESLVASKSLAVRNLALHPRLPCHAIGPDMPDLGGGNG